MNWWKKSGAHVLCWIGAPSQSTTAEQTGNCLVCWWLKQVNRKITAGQPRANIFRKVQGKAKPKALFCFRLNEVFHFEMEQLVCWRSLLHSRLEKKAIRNLKIGMFQIFRAFFFLFFPPANFKRNSSEQQTVAALLNLPFWGKFWSLKGWMPLLGMQQNKGAAPSCSPYCTQLTRHRLLQHLHLQTQVFHLHFPFPSTLRLKFILQARKLLYFDSQNFLLKKKPTAGSCLKNKCNVLSRHPPPKNA